MRMRQTIAEPLERVYCGDCGAGIFTCAKCYDEFEEGEILFCDIQGVADRKANMESHFCSNCSGIKIVEE